MALLLPSRRKLWYGNFSIPIHSQESRWRARQHLSDRSIKRAASKLLQQQLQNAKQDNSNNNDNNDDAKDTSTNLNDVTDSQSTDFSMVGGGFLQDSDEEDNSQHNNNKRKTQAS